MIPTPPVPRDLPLFPPRPVLRERAGVRAHLSHSQLALNIPSVIALSLLLTTLPGCQSTHHPSTPAPKPTLSHVVLCWLKEPGNAAQRTQLIETSKSFHSIPGVVSITAGTPLLPSTRPVVDSTYDVGIIITFKDEHSLAAYESHPTHQKAVIQTLRPLTSKLLVYDILHR